MDMIGSKLERAKSGMRIESGLEHITLVADAQREEICSQSLVRDFRFRFECVVQHDTSSIKDQSVLIIGSRVSAPPSIYPVRATRLACRNDLRAIHARDREVRAMAPKIMAVFCIYPDQTSFEYAICALKVAGFHDEDVSVLLQADSQLEGLPSGKTGKEKGGIVGVAGFAGKTSPALGWLAEPNAIRIPGDGTFLISGPLLATLKGTESLGKTDGLIGSLLNIGLPEQEVKQYMGRLKEGGILFSVYCHHPDYADKAKTILGSTGAEVICDTRNKRAE